MTSMQQRLDGQARIADLRTAVSRGLMRAHAELAFVKACFEYGMAQHPVLDSHVNTLDRALMRAVRTFPRAHAQVL